MLKFDKIILIFLLLGFLVFFAVKQNDARSNTFLKKNFAIDKNNTTQVKILIPLYSYPNWYDAKNYLWREVAAAAKKVPIVAIINPNNGPGADKPNKDYQKGIEDLRKAKITILGYVYTKYGDRNIAEVKADIDLYARHFDVNGIFLDEAASRKEKLAYYQQIYKYIKSRSKLKTVVLNQGTHTDRGYLQKPATDIAVIFENYSKAWQEYQPQSYVSQYRRERFSSLIHTVTDAATMKKHLDRAIKNNIGYIYITDDSPDSSDRDPWNSLPSYWKEEIDYIYFLNNK
jgi:Spherulation-specific family 4